MTDQYTVMHVAYGLLGDGQGGEWDHNQEYTRAIAEMVRDLIGSLPADEDDALNVLHRIREYVENEEQDEFRSSYWQDDTHPLLAGMLLGVLMRKGIDAEPVMDGRGNYSDVMSIRMPYFVNGIQREVTVRVLP
jgi:hypothetical protein